jgi:hypothetical protein
MNQHDRSSGPSGKGGDGSPRRRGRKAKPVRFAAAAYRRQSPQEEQLFLEAVRLLIAGIARDVLDAQEESRHE